MNWKHSKGPVDANTLGETEIYFGVDFPEFLKSIIKKHNGARPRPSNIQTIEGKEVKIKSLLPIGQEYSDNIIAVNNHLKAKIPKDLIAFANDSFGNYFCFYNEDNLNKEKEVIFWEHESSNVYKINMDNFL